MNFQPATIEEAPVVTEEIQEMDDTDHSVALSAYYEEGSECRPPVFCPQLGLAVEEIKQGFTLETLWQVIPLNKASTPTTAQT